MFWMHTFGLRSRARPQPVQVRIHINIMGWRNRTKLSSARDVEKLQAVVNAFAETLDDLLLPHEMTILENMKAANLMTYETSQRNSDDSAPLEHLANARAVTVLAIPGSHPAALFAITSSFTMVITNNGTAAIMFPFAIAIAAPLGVSPRPFVIAVALGASTRFASPIGYQTNLMIYAPGGYRFTDFLRIGLPLNLIILIIATALIPLVWRF